MRRDFYVDDVLSGADDLEAACKLQAELLQLLQAGRFLLRKWAANHSALLHNIPLENRQSSPLKEFQEENTIRTLGLLWDTNSDQFTFQVPPVTDSEHPTKRKILSAIARLYDPLGWLSPVTIVAKILLQNLWLSKLDWDTPLPNELASSWITH